MSSVKKVSLFGALAQEKITAVSNKFGQNNVIGNTSSVIDDLDAYISILGLSSKSTDLSNDSAAILSNTSFGAHVKLVDKNGEQVVKVAHSENSLIYTYDFNTGEESYMVTKEIMALHISKNIPIDWSQAGSLSHVSEITSIQYLIKPTQDTTKIVVYPTGAAFLFMAQDKFSSFSLSMKISPVNQKFDSTVLQVSAGNLLGNSETLVYGNTLSGPGHAEVTIFGKVEHI